MTLTENLIMYGIMYEHTGLKSLKATVEDPLDGAILKLVEELHDNRNGVMAAISEFLKERNNVTVSDNELEEITDFFMPVVVDFLKASELR